MSLRMNVYGWSYSAFTRALGGRDAHVLEVANAELTRMFPKSDGLTNARAWLTRLIDSGFPLRQERNAPVVPAGGGLVTVGMETEMHVFVVYSILRAIAESEHLNLSQESSYWKHPAIHALLDDMEYCGFTRTEECGRKLPVWLIGLSRGTPLFGDDFLTSWSYYTSFANQDLGEFVQGLKAAADFSRKLPQMPPGFPADQVKNIRTSLSDEGKQLAADMTKWFGQIHQAGQDAFVLWW